MKFKNSEKGFTLIELLVVIAIIGILSSVVLASMNTARTKARDARRQADLKSLQLALESYYDSNGSYPSVTGEVAATEANLGALTPDYITALPADPAASQSYYYESNGDNYCLGAEMENTAPTPANTCTTAIDLGTTAGSWTNAYRVGQ